MKPNFLFLGPAKFWEIPNCFSKTIQERVKKWRRSRFWNEVSAWSRERAPGRVICKNEDGATFLFPGKIGKEWQASRRAGEKGRESGDLSLRASSDQPRPRDKKRRGERAEADLWLTGSGGWRDGHAHRDTHTYIFAPCESGRRGSPLFSVLVAPERAHLPRRLWNFLEVRVQCNRGNGTDYCNMMWGKFEVWCRKYGKNAFNRLILSVIM